MDNNGGFLSVFVCYGYEDILKFIREHIKYIRYVSSLVYKELKDIPDFEFKYDCDLDIFQSIELTKEFLDYIDREHMIKFENSLNDGSVDIFETESICNHSYVEFHGDLYDMSIDWKHNLDDVFSFVHEYFHTTNYKGKNSSLDRILLTESISIFYEFVLYDYLKRYSYFENDSLSCLKYRLGLTFDDSNSLIKIIDELNGYLDDLEILKNVDIDNYDNIEKDYNRLIYPLKYVISTYVAIILFDSYKNNRITLNNIKSLNESIGSNNHLESLRNVMLSVPDEECFENSMKYFKDEFKYVLSKK